MLLVFYSSMAFCWLQLFFNGKGALSINFSLALEWDIFYYFILYALFEHCLEIFNTCCLHLDFTNVFSTKTGLEIYKCASSFCAE